MLRGDTHVGEDSRVPITGQMLSPTENDITALARVIG